jgi:hypothetical protein
MYVNLGGQQSLTLCQISAAGQWKASMSVEDINVEFHQAMLRKLDEHPGNDSRQGKAMPTTVRGVHKVHSCRVVVFLFYFIFL